MKKRILLGAAEKGKKSGKDRRDKRIQEEIN